MSPTSGVKLHIHLLNMVVRFIVFLTSATLILRGTDISKCFREPLGIRDNESRLYCNIKGINETEILYETIWAPLCTFFFEQQYLYISFVCESYADVTENFATFICQGPVVQSVVSLTSSLRVISLTVLADSIYNILIVFAEKMWVAFALQKLLTFFQ